MYLSKANGSYQNHYIIQKEYLFMYAESLSAHKFPCILNVGYALLNKYCLYSRMELFSEWPSDKSIFILLVT